ncbi:MAG: methyltransferase domain-containing protein [Hyphomonadaceae bacterium]|nr:methyltransferase domain-containing protein [Hyphomonadaceae bacterium]
MRRPRFIAEQARCAEGPLGRFIAFVMARETWGHNLRAIEALDIRPGESVLDVGCGPGRSLAELARRAQGGRIVGADPSKLMAKVATRRVRKSQAEIVVASAAALPFEDGAFDKALCVHVIYFWNDLPAAFQEIARVLKPGGRLALLFRTSADEAAVRAFPAEVYRFHVLSDVVAPLEATGFAVDVHDALRGEHNTPMLLIAAKRRASIPRQ